MDTKKDSSSIPHAAGCETQIQPCDEATMKTRAGVEVAPKMGAERCTLFATLPKELRLQIWEKVELIPRIVTLLARTMSSPQYTLYTTHSSSTPALLYVCSESRSTALKKYQLIFRSADRRGVYFSPEHDVLCLDSLPNHWLREAGEAGTVPFGSKTARTDVAMVQRVIVKSDDLGYLREGIGAQLEGMAGLRSVQFVYFDAGGCGYYWVQWMLSKLRKDIIAVLGGAAEKGKLELGFVVRMGVVARQRGQRIGDAEVEDDREIERLVKLIESRGL